LVDANVSEKFTASIFWVELAMLGSGGIYIRIEEEENLERNVFLLKAAVVRRNKITF
jgi:hypothetical protein